jgi:CBS domain-containing protein
MKVEQLMTQNVYACGPHDSLNTAAQMMWEHDCGCVPVVDADGRVVGVVTDRDVCMAAYTQGQTLCMIPVGRAMSKQIHTCSPDDTLTAAEAVMKAEQVRRLPVVDAQHRLVGILSLNDIARHAAHERRGRGKRAIAADEVVQTLGAICEPLAVVPAETAA